MVVLVVALVQVVVHNQPIGEVLYHNQLLYFQHHNIVLMVIGEEMVILVLLMLDLEVEELKIMELMVEMTLVVVPVMYSTLEPIKDGLRRIFWDSWRR